MESSLGIGIAAVAMGFIVIVFGAVILERLFFSSETPSSSLSPSRHAVGDRVRRRANGDGGIIVAIRDDDTTEASSYSYSVRWDRLVRPAWFHEFELQVEAEFLGARAVREQPQPMFTEDPA